MKTSELLQKIASFIDDPLQKIQKYQFNIKIYNDKIFIINSIKKSEETEQQLIDKIQLMINELEKHSNFIQTKAQFYLNKKQAPKKINQYIMIFGAYNCKNISDDEMRKIIQQWKIFGYKDNSISDKKIKTTQNSVY